MWWIFNGASMLGPALVLVGWGWGLALAFWLGATLCAFDEFMDVASGVHRLPIFAVVFTAAGAAIGSPWIVGGVLGLAVWTAIGFFGQFATKRAAAGYWGLE
ncbi:hypothetical protein [Azospirillum sp. B506]|uniref:hypothetical protein n=1 Tax=Azospirillum sp. B506 TaxID=137721 RepID=UPI0005B2BD62|nr:hypothetical protein [Azospirillum sp. B506]